ncbi:hypothetical protein Y919_10395 [Caloranaerobacter azorensis H53214]|uniref:Uncharacterized protein n=2 Tax=Caloranaerobacter azorensis TaxID=116090 RepID=A0A1M5VY55_9FIRM|nr:hypothetical protein [Caloranaerobacter azorensis]KGG79702.1 hypothetical protein Y919_10395 [Caloranaerobacter azorensis H53214]SHH79934.1 hypothetical protein SAMN02745135_02185 [Caloranaerobacter azorensis DSM 13643]
MTKINIGKGTKKFTHYYKIASLSDSKIISYRVKPSNLFADVLSNKKIIVYGDYDILFCFTNNSLQNQRYSAKFLKKTFCEIVNYDLSCSDKLIDIDKIEAIAMFPSQLTCTLNFINSGLTNKYINIKVSGEIKVDLFFLDKVSSDYDRRLVKQDINDLENEIVKEKKLYDEKKDIKKGKNQSLSIQCWQFEPEDNLTVYDMLEMDLEILKNSVRQIDIKESDNYKEE